MKMSVKRLVVLALLAALAYLVMAVLRVPVGFLTYEPKDVVITVGGFLMGPMAAFLISLTVCLLEMVTVSTTGIIGCIMNLLGSCAFCCTAAFLYKKRHTLGGAVTGLAVGSAAMVVTMLLWNWLITPLYMEAPREQVAAMLLPLFLPFNAIKAGLNAALTMALYKPLTLALRKTGLAPAREGQSGKARVGLYLVAGAVLVTCVLLLLVLRGSL